VAFPPLPQRGERRREDTGREAPQKKRPLIRTGLTLRGVERQVDPYPPGLEEGERAEHDALMSALTPVLEKISLQGNKEGLEYRVSWAQLNSLKSQLCALRIILRPRCPQTRHRMASAGVHSRPGYQPSPLQPNPSP